MDLFSSRMLLYQPYQNGEVLIEKDISGTFDFELKGSGVYELTVVGGGGGGAGTKSTNSSASSAGASGSGFVGWLYLEKGFYKIVVGGGGYAQYGLDMNAWGGVGGSSSINFNNINLISSPGGGGGHSWWRSGSENAIPGALPTISKEILKTILHKQGATGARMSNPGYGGSSVIAGTTYGKGGDAHIAASNTISYPGNTGYVKVVFVALR